MEQYVIEHEVQADKYKEYLKKADYYEELKSRKLSTLPIQDRLKILFNLQ